jgi:hypothetical protein
MNKNTYKTTDLALSSYLSLTVNLLEIVRLEGNRCEFVFQESAELLLKIESFFNNTARVSPVNYFNAIKSLKTRIYSRS